MNIVIVGLGLMGASYASALTKLGHDVYGVERNKTVYKEALNQKIIKDEEPLNALSKANVVIITLYPKDVITFLKMHKHLFKDSQIITDIAGVKHHINRFIENEEDLRSYYVSHHPMAGRERQNGFFYDDKMFKDANCILIENDYTNHDKVVKLKQLLSTLLFKQFIHTTAVKHDALIAYTSQLTHAIALSLIKADEDPLTVLATGDSFRDLTRIAKINEVMWSELFLENSGLLQEKIDVFIEQLSHLKTLIGKHDAEALKQFMKDGHEKRKHFD